jgi:GNAT superfamily N-acetyltransferase
MNLVIRRAGLVDVPQLLALYKLLDIEPEPEMPIQQASQRFLDLVSDPEHRIYVAEFEQQIVGTFALIFVGGLSHGARHACIVEDVVVAPEAQRAGIGKQMMRFAMDKCAGGRCYKLVLSSHLNRSNAHRFYESLGFRRHGYSYLIDRFGDDGADSDHSDHSDHSDDGGVAGIANHPPTARIPNP